MSNDNHQVAHLWANQSKPRAKSSNGNFHFDGAVIYSYATPIAKLYPGCALVTSRSYTATTSGKHMPAMRRALEGKVFYVPSIGHYGGMNRDDANKPKHGDNLKHFQEAFASAINSWRLAKDAWRVNHASECAADTADKMLAYAECFKLKVKAWRKPYDAFNTTREAVLAYRAEQEAKRNSPEQIAKRAKDQARRDAKRARQFALAQAAETERAQAWLTGELDHYRTNYNAPAFLRVKGDQLQTSQGANVPLAHAIRAFKFIAARKAASEPWKRNGHSLHVGAFQVDTIDAGGNIKAGCHSILWNEIERIARQLNLMES